jgi:hypothetical protein
MKKETKILTTAVPDHNTLGIDLGFDLEGLVTDFPTAGELQKFVFDQTGVTLNLKGRSNKLKYQIALDVLNGNAPPVEVLGGDNPYLDKNDVVPEEPMRVLPPQPAEIRGHQPVTQFQCDIFPHPDPQWAASGQKCSVVFKKYIDNTITYEILGPIAKRAVGERVNKYGQSTPEKYVWVDPREGERIIRYADGRVTPTGTRLKNFMSRMRIGNSSQWDTWIDRDFVIGGNASAAIDNPWNV